MSRQRVVVVILAVLAVVATGYLSVTAQSQSISDGLRELPAPNIPEASRHGEFITKTEYDAAKDEYKDRKLIYFFHAEWCFTCKAVAADARANLGLIPADVVIVEVDFDTETELREKYQVTGTTTFVQIDDKGNKINLWQADNAQSMIAEIK